MPFWNTVTTDDVMKRFNDAEAAAYKNMQSSDDPLGDVLQDVIDSTRGKIRAGGKQLGPDGTTPDSLKREIITIARWDWITAFSKNEKLQTDGRKKEYDEAIELMNKVASGEQAVELPDPGPAVDQAILPAISPRKRRFQHEDGV
jgi:phage gp36-like protein